MTDKEKTNEHEKRKETTKAKVLNKRMEELRRWFESQGDCT